MCDFKNLNTQLIEVPVLGVSSPGNTDLRFNFPNIPYLDYTFIRSIETFTVNDMSVGPSNTAVIDAATLKKSFLTLYISKLNQEGIAEPGGGEWMRSIPLTSLHRVQNSSTDPFVRDLFLMNNQIVSWDTCYINVGSAIGNTANKVFVFNVGFAFNPNKPY